MEFIVPKEKRIHDLKTYLSFIIKDYTLIKIYNYGSNRRKNNERRKSAAGEQLLKKIIKKEGNDLLIMINEIFREEGISYQQFPNYLFENNFLNWIDEQFIKIVNQIKYLKIIKDAKDNNDFITMENTDILEELNLELYNLFDQYTFMHYCDELFDEKLHGSDLFCIYFGNLDDLQYNQDIPYNNKSVHRETQRSSSAGGTKPIRKKNKTKKIHKTSNE